MAAVKPHLYLLHGWSIDTQNEKKWQNFITRLNKLGVSTTFLGIPGLSSQLDEAWQLDDFVKWLGQQLSQEPIYLLGHSFGGQIAIKYAAKHRHHVKKLILIDSSGIRDQSLTAKCKRSGFKIAAKLGKRLFNSQAARSILYKLARESDYKNAPPLLRKTMSNILDEEVKDDLAKITTPTLIIWGASDSVTPIKLGWQMQEAISNNTFVVIDDARHSPQFTHSDQVAAEVTSFIQSKS